MKKSLFSLCMLVMLFMGVRSAPALATSPHMSGVLTIAQMPAVLRGALLRALPNNCNSGSCEGLAPPPINACPNGNKVVVTELSGYSSDNTWMYLYSGNCSALWVAIYYDGTGTTNDPTVNAVGVWEASANCDGSNRGALDTLPVTLSPTHRWESTYMIAADDSGCTGGANFHGAEDTTIHGLDSGIVNGNTWYQ